MKIMTIITTNTFIYGWLFKGTAFMVMPKMIQNAHALFLMKYLNS